jgi:hypothetical protein
MIADDCGTNYASLSPPGERPAIVRAVLIGALSIVDFAEKCQV